MGSRGVLVHIVLVGTKGTLSWCELLAAITATHPRVAYARDACLNLALEALSYDSALLHKHLVAGSLFAAPCSHLIVIILDTLLGSDTDPACLLWSDAPITRIATHLRLLELLVQILTLVNTVLHGGQL